MYMYMYVTSWTCEMTKHESLSGAGVGRRAVLTRCRIYCMCACLFRELCYMQLLEFAAGTTPSFFDIGCLS